MRKQIALAAVLFLSGIFFAGQGAAQAKEKKSSGIKKQYNYVIQGKSVRITKYIGKVKKVTIPSKIEGKKVTEIGVRAFNNSKVISVKIPNTVEKVKYLAFSGAKQLKQVKMSDNVTRITDNCFVDCLNLEKINMPKKLKSIGSAFWNCIKLKKITLPKGVTSIGYKAFADCTSLTEVKINSRLKKIDGEAFDNCKNLVSVGDITVDSVEWNAFRGCSKLTSKIILSDKCTKVGNRAFYNCEQAEIVIPETIKHIGVQAFANCQKLTSITIPADFEGIGIEDNGGFKPGFEDLDSDYEKFLRNRVGWNFDMNAYAGCANISNLIIKNTSGAFVEENGILYNKDKTAVLYVLPTYKGSLDFLKNVDTIGSYAMSGFNQAEITVPDNVKNIWSGAFYGAKSTQIQLGKGVKKLYDETFSHSGITSLTIPEGIEEIMDEAISYCADCKTVSLPKSLRIMNYDGDFSSPLRGMSGLEKVEVAEGNPTYYSKDGMLFESDHVLLCYPAARQGSKYTLPMDVRLGGYAFDSLKYLKKIIIPEGAAATRGYNLMVDCKDVTVRLPKSFTQFPSQGHSRDFPLFTNCKNCKALVYKNSKAHKYCKKECDKEKRFTSVPSFQYAYQVIK